MYRGMDSLQRFDKIYKYLVLMAAIMGVDLFKHSKLNWRIILCISVILMGSASVLYTLYIVRDDFVIQLKCLCAAMQAIQVNQTLYIDTIMG